VFLKNNNVPVIDHGSLSARTVLIVALFCLSLAIQAPDVSAAASNKNEYDYRAIRIKEDRVRAGRIYYDAKMYDKAVELWEKALEIDPNDKNVTNLLNSAKKRLETKSKAAVTKEEGARLKELEAKKIEDAGLEQERQRREELVRKEEERKAKLEQVRLAEEKKPQEEPSAREAPQAEKPEELKAEEPKPEEPKAAVEEEGEPPVRTEEPAPEAVIEEDKLPPSEPEPAVTPPVSAGPEFGAKEPIVVNGDRVEYFQEKQEVVGTGNISITYKDVVLTCDRITVHLDTREGEASGNVKVTQKDAYMTGDRISYNFDTRKGSIVDGYVDAKPFYGRAQQVDKLANKEQVNMERGYFTTCNLDKPHYRVQSREVKIYLDDKVVAKHILLFAGNIPVLYMPYYVQPLNQGKTHVTVIPGESKEWGYYALTSIRYYLDDLNRGDILLDYRSKKGLGMGINHYYDTKRVGNGAVKFYYTYENYLVYRDMGEKRSKYRVQLRHRWDIEEDTAALVEFNKLSDRNFIKDYFYNEYEELGDRPDSYISVITQKTDFSTQFLLRKRFDDFNSVVERLPEYSIDIPNNRIIKDLPIYYQAKASAGYLNQTYDNTGTSSWQKDIGSVRVDVNNQLSYAARFFKALSVTPYGGIENTYYSRNKWGTTNQVRTVFNAGVDNSIKFYKIYDVETNVLGLDINKLRHIITPTANYYFTHQPTISPDNLIQFDEIDARDKQNGIRFAVENRLQTKRLEGDQMKSVDLATLIISTDYAFRLKKHSLATYYEKFKTVDLELELIPYSWAYLLSKMSINTKKYDVQTESIDLVVHRDDKWSVAIGHRYENAGTGRTNLVTFDGNYKINEKWKFRAYGRYNAEKASFEEQEYTIDRDLHCWIAELTYNIKDMGDQSVWFVMKLKAFPEYSIGLKRTYSRPRFGSTGAQ